MSLRDSAAARALGIALVFAGAVAIAGAAYWIAAGRVGGPVETRMGGAVGEDLFRLSFWPAPRPVPNLRFADGTGRTLSLADSRGRPVVLNIWATWCVPCRKEMPTLNRLQAGFDKSVLLVLPLSIDRQGAAAVRRFYESLGLKALGIYVDASGEAANRIDAPGIPTTLFLDRGGREVGRKIGPADWDSRDIVKALRAHLRITERGPGSGS